MRQIDNLPEDVWFDRRAADVMEVMIADETATLDTAIELVLTPHADKLDVPMATAATMVESIIGGAEMEFPIVPRAPRKARIVAIMQMLRTRD